MPADTKQSEEEYVRAFQRLVGAVFRLNGQLLSTAEGLSKDLEISTGRWQAIAAIRHQPLTTSQLARRIGISRQSARQTVQKLEAGGLVELTENPDHRRSQLILLTERGTEVMDILRERQSKLTHFFTDGAGLDIGSIDDLTAQLENLRVHAEEAETQNDLTA